MNYISPMSAPREQVRKMQAEDASDGEPIIEGLERKVTDYNGSESLITNLTSQGRDIVGFERGKMVQIDIYRDHIEIRPKETDE